MHTSSSLENVTFTDVSPEPLPMEPPATVLPALFVFAPPMERMCFPVAGLYEYVHPTFSHTEYIWSRASSTLLPLSMESSLASDTEVTLVFRSASRTTLHSPG